MGTKGLDAAGTVGKGSGLLDKLRLQAKQMKREGRFQVVSDAMQWAWNLKKRIADLMIAPAALSDLAALGHDAQIERYIGAVCNDLRGFLKPIQNVRELTEFLKRVQRAQPSLVMEIGTAKGGTLFLMSKAAASDATLISCDLPGGLYGGGYPAWKSKIFHRLIAHPKTLHLVRADSHEKSTRAQIVDLLGGRQIDLLFIDGDHTYEGVKHDFMLYRDLVRPGGLIGFHDIVVNRFDPDIDVARFWNEAKTDYVTEEIVDDPQQGCLGIGLLHVPERW